MKTLFVVLFIAAILGMTAVSMAVKEGHASVVLACIVFVISAIIVTVVAKKAKLI